MRLHKKIKDVDFVHFFLILNVFLTMKKLQLSILMLSSFKKLNLNLKTLFGS